MIESMAQVRITEAELAADVYGMLDRVQRGVERNHRPVAIVHSPLPKGRMLCECIALAESRGSTATLDEGFMQDVEEGISRPSQPWNPPIWESPGIGETEVALCAITVAELAHGIHRADTRSDANGAKLSWMT